MRAGWKAGKIGDVCTVIAGQSPKGSAYNDQGVGLPFYQGKKEFRDRHIGPPTTWTSVVTKEGEPGDILMSVRAPVGPINEATRRICIGRGLAAIRAKDGLNRDFLWYALSWLQPTIKGSSGAVFDSINKAGIERLPIPLPPLEEQQRIVAVLDEAFEGLARARAHAEANLQNARELFESYLGNVFGDKTWPEKMLDEVSENLDRVRVPITKSDRIAGDIPYYGASGVVDHVADYLFDEDLLLVSEDGANLLARTYPIAFSISGKSWVNNHAHVLRFDDPDAQEFVRLYLNLISLEPYVSGMAQPKLNQKQLNRIPIPFPNDKMRAEIVRKAHAISEETQRLEANVEASLQDLDDLRQSLLQRAFAGELT